MHVVLVRPEIATNTGNIIRLCANTGAHLHLVEPLGFSMDDRLLRRAGLDYHELAEVSIHAGLFECDAALPNGRKFAFSARAATRYDRVDFRPDDIFVFGAERAGLQSEDLETIRFDDTLTIPMRSGNRSLNLANAVAIVVYEAWRQQNFVNSADAAATTSESLDSSPFDT